MMSYRALMDDIKSRKESCDHHQRESLSSQRSRGVFQVW
jgi:hypothetical protein